MYFIIIVSKDSKQAFKKTENKHRDCLYGYFHMKGLVYTQCGQNIRSFFHPGWVSLNTYTKITNEFPTLIFLTVKMGSGLFLFRKMRLLVSKTYPAAIGPSCKIYDMLPLLYPSILHHHILPLSRIWKILQVHFKLNGTHNMIEKFSFSASF